jgi:aryl sulfotransferase
MMKTHFPYSKALPLAAHTAGAIYVVRDPGDVMLSNFYYGQRSGDSPLGDAAAFDRYVDAFIEHRGDARWIRLGMGSWEDNVRSWIAGPHEFPVVRIRYEDLMADGVAIAGLLCRCLGLARSAADIASAVARSSFERMRQIEEQDIREQRVGIFYKPYLKQPIDAGLRFMRSGRSGEALAALRTEQRERFDHAFAPLRRELGYG